jgi:hypothetical protein
MDDFASPCRLRDTSDTSNAIDISDISDASDTSGHLDTNDTSDTIDTVYCNLRNRQHVSARPKRIYARLSFL